MPEPVLWTITESLKSALEDIDGTGSYFYTVSSVSYGTNEEQSLQPGEMVLRIADASRDADETQGKYYWRAIYDVTLMVEPDASVPDIQAMARMFSDIQLAVMDDPQRTVSGTRYAIDTQVIAPNFREGYDERSGITCQIEVFYRNSITDPTSL